MPRLVSVVIPCHNEEDNVPLLAERVDAVFAALPDCDHEVLFVNDGSTDGTAAALDALAAASPHIRPVHLTRNFGQSAALIAGMRAAQGAYVLTLDGDLQNDPCDFPRILDLLGEYDCVCGYRATREDVWWRRLVSGAANRVLQGIVKSGVRDAGCGTKGFRRACIPHLLPFDGVHRFFAVMVHNAGLSVTECSVTHHPRVHGASKYGIHNRLWRTLFDLAGVAWLRRRYVNPQTVGDGTTEDELSA